MYEVLIYKKAQKAIEALPKQIQRAIGSDIEKLAQDPRPKGCEKLKGYELYRIRTGDYRTIYEINDNVLTVLVVKIGHRGDVYKGL